VKHWATLDFKIIYFFQTSFVQELAS